MRSIAKDISRGLREMERRTQLDPDDPDLLGVADLELPCVASSFGRQVEIDPEGNEVVIDLKVFVRREVILTTDLEIVDGYLFTDDGDSPVPVSGTEVTFRGRTMLCVMAKESGPRSHFEFSLKDQAAA